MENSKKADQNNDIKVQQGIIGFFDILGYQSFLDSNPIKKVSPVLNALNFLDGEIRTFLLKSNHNEKLVESLVKRINWLIFSDTILLTCPFSVKDDDIKRIYRWTLISYASISLIRYMFQFGLPVRGVINTGEFIVKGNCFAGKPIVQAYRLTQDLNLATCVFTENAFKEVSELCMKNKDNNQVAASFEKAFGVLYLVPRKSGKKDKLFSLNFLETEKPKSIEWDDDLRQVVLNSFWKHNKDVSEEVQNKVTNTEQFLRFLKYHSQT